MRRMIAEKEADKLRYLNVDDGDVTITGNLAAEKLEQKTANYSQNIYYTTPSNSEITNLYCNCKVINGVMYLVVNVKIKNLSEDSQTYYYISAAGFSLPNSVAEKLVDMDGETVLAAKAANTLIASVQMQIFASWTGNPTPMETTTTNIATLNLLNGTEANNVIALIAGNMTIPAGETRILTGRIPLTLI